MKLTQLGGTATAGADYVDFAGGAIAVLPGQTTGVFNVVVNDDLLFENTETVTATITDPIPPIVTIITPTATANITDDDNTAGSITADLSTTVAAGDENGPVDIVFTVTLTTTNNTDDPIDFPIAQTGGNAVSGDDFAAFTTISVPQGSNTGTLTVSVTDDNSIENLETLDVTLSAPTDPAIVVGASMGSATIADGDSGAGTVDADLSVTIDGFEAVPFTLGVQYTVTLAKTNGTGAPFVYNINPTGGTAIAGTDFTDFTGTGTISIPDGSNTGTFIADVLDDALLDGTRTLEATISGTPHPALNINTASATGDIADNETATASVSATQVGEETGPIGIIYTVTLSLTNNTGGSIMVDINPTGGSATAGTDFTDFTGAQATIVDGSSTGNLLVIVNDDALFENTETVDVIISNPSFAAVTIGTATATGSILDSDNAAASVNADISTISQGDEAGSNIVYYVTLAKVNNTHGDITVNIDPTGGTATAGSDYIDFSGSTVVIPDGSDTGSFSVVVSDDALLEATESVQSTISAASDPAININTSNASADIADNETANADLSVTTDGAEPGTNIVYTVTLDKTNNTGVPITFNIDPSAGTATAGSDYTDFTGVSISVADGASTGTFTVVVSDDMALEGTETVEATISNSSNPAVTITTATATADLDDNEAADATLSATINGDETGPVSIEYTVTLTSLNNSGSAIDFDINPTGGSATATDDYTDFAGGTISVADGATSGTITVPVVDDMLFENTETVQATISNASHPAVTIVGANATANIADSDNAAASINADLSVTTHGDEDGPVNVVYTVTLAKTNNTHGDISFFIDPTAGTAVTPGDYVDFTGSSITVPDGSATGTFTVTVNDDALFDGDRSLDATITAPTDPAININTATSTATIADDEAPDADVSVTTNGDETGPVNIVYTVTLSLTNNTGGNVTLDIDPTAGNATAGNDFIDFAGSTVTIADGDSTGTITVIVNDDLLYENDENVVATISNPSHPNVNINTPTADATIVDDDNTGITTTFSATTAGDETGPVSLVYTVTISKVNNTHVPVTFDIDPTGGNSNHTQDYTNFAGQTVSIADGTDTGTFTVTIVDDVRFENNETLISTISNVSDPAAITITGSTATGAIIDNDNAPGSVEAVLSRTSDGSETGSSLIGYTITLELPNHTHQPITFDIDPTAGTATAGVDYDDFATNTISVPDGSSFATILIPVNDDAILEGTETVEATIANPTDPAIGIVTASANANVLDDDDAVANLSVTTNGSETGPTSIVYTVTLTATNNTGSAITFNINPTAGTATAGSDYTTFAGGTISVADGASTGTLTVAVTDDTAFENTETVQATISNSSSTDVTIGTAAATATITDNDNTSGSIGADLSVTTYGEETGPQNIVYTVTLASPNNTGSPVTLDIAPFAGSAINNVDYTFNSNTVSIANGSTTGSVTVTVVDDALFENDETLEAAINNPSDPAVFVNTPNATANIIDNDNAPSSVNATLSVTTHGEEDESDIVFTVTLDKANNTNGPLDFTILDGSAFVGTATVGDDYDAFDGMVITVPNGSTTGSITIPVVDDSLFENTEIVVAGVPFSSDPAVTFGTSGIANANIIDDDNAAGSITATLDVSLDGSETGPTSIEYTVTIDKVNNTQDLIQFTINPVSGTATAGTDYTDFTGQVISISPGDDFGTITVPVINDTLFENTETVTAELSAPSDPAITINSAIPAEAVIVDNDNSAASVAATLSATTNGNEAGPISVVYTVTLANANNTGAPINFTINPAGGTATTGTDYVNFAGGTISVANGSTSGTFSVTVANDTLFEATETLMATISSPSDPAVTIAGATATANVFDDDSVASTINADLSVQTHGSETGPTSIVYRVTLATINNTGSAVTFSINPTGGTATAGTDYTTFAGGTVSVANGASFGTTTVTVANDSLFENTETVQATISSPSNPAITINTASAIANISDNDNTVNSVNANLSVTTNGNETGPTSIVYTVTLASTNNTGSAIQFSINPTGGTATAASDYTNFAGSLVTIANGATSGTLTVPVVDDALFENTETVQATISNATDPAINVVTGTVLANISDNDNTSVNANLSVTTHGSEVGTTNVVYTLALANTNNTGSPITFAINATGGSASAGSDYINFSGTTLTIPNGQSSATQVVSVNDDALFENTETIIATVSGASDPAINLATPSATANIADNDNTNINTVLSATTNGDETGPVSMVYTVTIAKTNNTHGAITVDIDSNGGTATEGDDYLVFSGSQVTINDGESTGTITVPVVDDTLFENNESAIATISNSSDPALVLGTATATASIVDNDNLAGSIDANIAATVSGNETGSVNTEYEVTLAKVNNTHGPISFNVTINTGGTADSGSDYSSLVPATVVVPDGSDTGTLIIGGIVDDTLFENNETIIAAISLPSDPAIAIDTAEATGQIIDNDNAAGSINADVSVQTDGEETGPVSVVYKVELAKANNTHGPITVNINPSGGNATAADDYANFTGSTVTIADGASSGSISVAIVDDALFENTETVDATISSPSDPALNINTASTTADIVDNDNAAGSIDAVISTTTNGDEDGPVDIVYTVTLAKTNNTHGNITVAIDPTGGTADTDDYTNFAGGTVTIADGSNVGTFTVSVADDTVSENTETVEATISAASDPAINLATDTSSANIADNDGFDLLEPIYSLWNGFLNHINIIALANKGTAVNNITVTLYDLNGTALSVNNYNLNPGVEFDLIVNQLPGYTANSYGSVKIEYTQPMSIEGQSSISRVRSSDPTQYEYSLLHALSNKKTGKTYAFFNTFQPSTNPAYAAIRVFSYAEIVNLSSTTKRFKVEKFSQSGSLISAASINIPANGRRDVEAGHESPGANNVGKIIVTPIDGSGLLDATTEYMAQIATYGPSVTSGTFDFAFSEEFRNAGSDVQHINISRGAGANNWVAVANTATSSQLVNMKVINNAGTVLTDTNISLAAGAQTHVTPDTVLAAGASGIVILTPESGKTVIANGRSYFYNSTGVITDANLEESRAILRGPLYTSYNTFLGQSNWLRAFNVGTNDVTINVEVLSLTGTSLGNANFSIPAGSGRDVEVTGTLGIPVPANSYGLVKVTSNDNPSIVAHMLRLKFGTTVDLGRTLPLR